MNSAEIIFMVAGFLVFYPVGAWLAARIAQWQVRRFWRHQNFRSDYDDRADPDADNS
jgi:hypothetical protein